MNESTVGLERVHPTAVAPDHRLHLEPVGGTDEPEVEVRDDVAPVEMGRDGGGRTEPSGVPCATPLVADGERLERAGSCRRLIGGDEPFLGGEHVEVHGTGKDAG